MRTGSLQLCVDRVCGVLRTLHCAFYRLLFLPFAPYFACASRCASRVLLLQV